MKFSMWDSVRVAGGAVVRHLGPFLKCGLWPMLSCVLVTFALIFLTFSPYEAFAFIPDLMSAGVGALELELPLAGFLIILTWLLSLLAYCMNWQRFILHSAHKRPREILKGSKLSFGQWFGLFVRYLVPAGLLVVIAICIISLTLGFGSDLAVAYPAMSGFVLICNMLLLPYFLMYFFRFSFGLCDVVADKKISGIVPLFTFTKKDGTKPLVTIAVAYMIFSYFLGIISFLMFFILSLISELSVLGGIWGMGIFFCFAICFFWYWASALFVYITGVLMVIYMQKKKAHLLQWNLLKACFHS